jgi:hypothetical protein
LRKCGDESGERFLALRVFGLVGGHGRRRAIERHHIGKGLAVGEDAGQFHGAIEVAIGILWRCRLAGNGLDLLGGSVKRGIGISGGLASARAARESRGL